MASIVCSFIQPVLLRKMQKAQSQQSICVNRHMDLKSYAAAFMREVSADYLQTTITTSTTLPMLNHGVLPGTCQGVVWAANWQLQTRSPRALFASVSVLKQKFKCCSSF